ncbi:MULTISPECIES: shikimate dehydrogenase [Prochlorococcus]|uniref:shikimate dehydrogenase n=1 Tax=Prochlorococcus TaxID=1218 RepID=UPI000533B51D|nr:MULTISPECIES: shikimate dehydrogenase [Prochlorococcus]KGG13743.1 Shikimate 5-dehydrogenase I alpha [Prochlorococcus sp. MIT 0601]
MKETQLTISGETSFAGVLGDPVSHSLSPIIQNAALAKLNINWCYLAIPCSTQNLEEVIKTLRKINCKGLNITIPHKTNVFELCNEVSPIARKVGAINTLIPNGENGWLGTNTDVEGFIKPLKKNNDLIRDNALILGSGGSARAVAIGLQALEFSNITIISRNEQSLNELIELLNSDQNKNVSIKVKGILSTDINAKNFIKDANLIVNTTPAGMHNKFNVKSLDSIIPFGERIWDGLNSKSVLYDLIYTPMPTQWLKLGAKHNCKQINGLEMLIEQGAASLRLWSGVKEIPIDIMNRAAKAALNLN